MENAPVSVPTVPKPLNAISDVDTSKEKLIPNSNSNLEIDSQEAKLTQRQLIFSVSKTFSVFTQERKYIIEVVQQGVDTRLLLKTYQQCLNLHKLLGKLFDRTPSFPYAIWLLHSEEEIAINLEKYFATLLTSEKIMKSFPMKLFLEEFDLQGKVCIITGGSNGIGKQTAAMMAQLKCHVILACRSKEKALQAIYDIVKETGHSNLEYMRLNLTSLTSVNTFVAKFLEKDIPLNYLILNAGIASTMPVLTEDGFESIMGVNHLAHFALTNGLIDALKRGAPSRVVAVSSESHKLADKIPLSFSEITKPISTLEIFETYNRSKLANCLFINALSRRLLEDNVACNIVHPGNVATGIFRDLPEIVQWGLKGVLMDPEEGAYSTLKAIVDPDLDGTTNQYFDSDGKIAEKSPLANSDILARQFWSFSEECINTASSS